LYFPVSISFVVIFSFVRRSAKPHLHTSASAGYIQFDLLYLALRVCDRGRTTMTMPFLCLTCFSSHRFASPALAHKCKCGFQFHLCKCGLWARLLLSDIPHVLDTCMYASHTPLHAQGLHHKRKLLPGKGIFCCLTTGELQKHLKNGDSRWISIDSFNSALRV